MTNNRLSFKPRELGLAMIKDIKCGAKKIVDATMKSALTARINLNLELGRPNDDKQTLKNRWVLRSIS